MKPLRLLVIVISINEPTLWIMWFFGQEIFMYKFETDDVAS